MHEGRGGCFPPQKLRICAQRAKRAGPGPAHSAPQRPGCGRQSRSIRSHMKGKLPLHTSPLTRRYFVNGLGAALFSAALFLRPRPFGEEAGTACRPPRRQPSGRVRGGTKRRMRFGEGSGHCPPPAPPRRKWFGAVSCIEDARRRGYDRGRRRKARRRG